MPDALRVLKHDVAKYIVRTARNLPSGPVSAPLRTLLVRDLYGRDGEPTPASRFAEQAGCLDIASRESCQASFDELASVEQSVRLGDEQATRRAIELATAIARVIEEASPVPR